MPERFTFNPEWLNDPAANLRSPIDTVRDFRARIEAEGRAAMEKDPGELTESEKAAIAIALGVGFRIERMPDQAHSLRVVTHPCGIEKIDGKWHSIQTNNS